MQSEKTRAGVHQREREGEPKKLVVLVEQVLESSERLALLCELMI